MLSTAALATAEAAINKALSYDPGTRLALERLAGQVLAVQLTTPRWTVYVLPGEGGLRLAAHYEGEVTTRLRGSLPALLRLAGSDRTSFRDSGVEVIGNTGLLVSLQQILKQLDIDWEEALSGIGGDILGPALAGLIRRSARYSRDQAIAVTRLTREYLTEESTTLASQELLDVFYDDVDKLRLDVDRIEARLHRLKSLLS